MRLLIKKCYPPVGWPGSSSSWEQLPNSGDLLKLNIMVPNLVGNNGGGWSNYSYKVTSHKMLERAMDNRGSKSAICESVAVKEQRVDGSWRIYPIIRLRCTLTGFERNYQVRNPSNQFLNKRSYSSIALKSSASKFSFNPWFITGLVDAEGSFMVRIRKNSKYRTGWTVVSIFSIVFDKKDLPLLEGIKAHFGGLGSIKKNGESTFSYRIESSEQIYNVILPYFNKYPLITQKLGDYLLFREVVELMNNKEHLTEGGLNKIVSIKASINRGLSDELKAAFPQCIPVMRPIMVNPKIPHPEWIAGFTSGEGCFKLAVKKSSRVAVGFQVLLVFQITQHARDEKLMESLISYFGCGAIEKDPRGPWLNFSVYNFTDNNEKILPFFHQHAIIGAKSEDFQDWCKVAKLMQTKIHLTKEGLDQIISIKSGMNKGRFGGVQNTHN